MATSRVATSRRTGGAAVVLALIALTTAGGAVPAAAAPPAAVSVVVSPDPTATGGVVGGQGLILTGAVPNPGQAIGVVQCKGTVPDRADALAGVTTVGGREVTTIEDRCATQVPGEGANPGVKWRFLASPADGTFGLTYWLAEGTIVQRYSAGGEGSFDCNPDDPCSLVVYQAGRADGGYENEPDTDPRVLKSIPLTFAADSTTQCGAATDGTATGAGPASMQYVLNTWGGATCRKGQPTPLLTDYTQSGERAGQDSFLSGVNDFAVTATSFADLQAPAKVTSTRAAVWTPLAAQAAVVAYQGGASVNDFEAGIYSQTPATDVSATLDELAALFSHDAQVSYRDLDTPLVERSPVLKAAAVGDGVNPERAVQPNGAPGDADSITLVASRAFETAGDSWKFGVTSRFPPLVAPPAESVPLYSSDAALRAQIDKKIYGTAGFVNGIRVYLTDSATAAQFGLRTVKIRNAAGAFVEPTPESMAAAVAGMKRTPEGLLVADPANPDPAAYPLPMVQYAASSAQAVDDPARKDRLVAFLRHATGTEGQAQLPAGLFPLTPALRTEAGASLAKIGAGVSPPPPTPTPAPSAPPTSSGPLPPASVGTTPGVADDTGGDLPAGPGDPGGDGAGAPAGTGGPGTGAAAPTGPQQLRAARPASAQAVSDAATIPVFPGLRNSALGRALPTIGLVLLALLVSTAGWLSSGRPVALPPAVRRRLPARLVRRLS